MNNIKLKALSFIILLCPLLSFLHSSPWSGHISPFFYADNTEFFNPWRSGETYLGNSVSTWAEYSKENVNLKAGVYLDAWYGDEPIIRDVSPLLRLTCSAFDGRFQFIFGSLNSSNRHNMLDALQSEELSYTRPNEYGFQIRQSYRFFQQDIWVNWNLLNTPAHREYFDFGNKFVFPFPFLTAEIQTYISHHGGQLYHNGPVADNLTLSAGIDNHFEFPDRLLSQAGWRCFYLTGKNVPDRGHSELTTSGNGLLVEAYVVIVGVRLYADYWKGNGFISEEGNSLYQCNTDYIFFGLKKEMAIGETTRFHIELRGHSLARRLEYQYNFGFHSAFDIF